jgi:hypothetical protein
MQRMMKESKRKYQQDNDKLDPLKDWEEGIFFFGNVNTDNKIINLPFDEVSYYAHQSEKDRCFYHEKSGN